MYLKRTHDQLNVQTSQAIAKHINKHNVFETSLVQLLGRIDINSTDNIGKLTAFIELYNKADNTASRNEQ